jgi:hypothetical protein
MENGKTPFANSMKEAESIDFHQINAQAMTMNTPAGSS